MTREEKIICKQFLNDADKTHSCNEYKLLMNLIDQETVSKDSYDHEYFLRRKMETQIDHLNKYISKLETQIVEQEPKWIPVSERLPEDSGEYLVSVIDKEDEEYKQVGVAWFAHPKDYDIKDGEWRELMINEKVIAWMPLPKAYREVEEDGNGVPEVRI